MDAMMAGMSVWGLLALLVVIALLVLAVLGSMWLSRQLPGRPAAPVDNDGDIARNRLRERYAAGEIDDEEFERRLSALTHWR